MPNWVKNRIIVSSDIPEDPYQAFLKAVGTQPVEEDKDTAGNEVKEYRCFDFNSLIPMPESLRVTSGTVSDKALLLVSIRDTWADVLAEYILKSDYRTIFLGNSKEEVKQEYKAIISQICSNAVSDKAVANAATAKLVACYREAYKAAPYHGTSSFFDTVYSEKDHYGYGMRFVLEDMRSAGIDPMTYDALRKYSETASGKEQIALGEQLHDNVRQYGAPTWYEWCTRNWNTKWNACDASVNVEQRCIEFDTAWSAPFAIMKALADKFPAVDWLWIYADENRGYNAGVFLHEKGILSGNPVPGGSSGACKIYVDLWGECDCMYQDEDSKWHLYDSCKDCPHNAECNGDTAEEEN